MKKLLITFAMLTAFNMSSKDLNPKIQDVYKNMIQAGFEYLQLKKNKPTGIETNISVYYANLEKAKIKRDQLRKQYQKLINK